MSTQPSPHGGEGAGEGEGAPDGLLAGHRQGASKAAQLISVEGSRREGFAIDLPTDPALLSAAQKHPELQHFEGTDGSDALSSIGAAGAPVEPEPLNEASLHAREAKELKSEHADDECWRSVDMEAFAEQQRDGVRHVADGQEFSDAFNDVGSNAVMGAVPSTEQLMECTAVGEATHDQLAHEDGSNTIGSGSETMGGTELGHVESGMSSSLDSGMSISLESGMSTANAFDAEIPQYSPVEMNDNEMTPWFADALPSERQRILEELNSHKGRQVRVVTDEGDGKSGKMISASNGFVSIALRGTKTPLRVPADTVCNAFNGRRLYTIPPTECKSKRSSKDHEAPPAPQLSGSLLQKHVRIIGGSNIGRSGVVLSGTQGYYRVEEAPGGPYFFVRKKHLQLSAPSTQKRGKGKSPDKRTVLNATPLAGDSESSQATRGAPQPKQAGAVSSAGGRNSRGRTAGHRRSRIPKEMADWLQSRDSFLGTANLISVVSWANFANLSKKQQEELSELLPDGDISEQSLRCEQLADAVRHWQQQLVSGEFDPTCEEVLQVRRNACLRREARSQERMQDRLKEALQNQGSEAAKQFCNEIREPAYALTTRDTQNVNRKRAAQIESTDVTQPIKKACAPAAPSTVESSAGIGKGSSVSEVSTACDSSAVANATQPASSSVQVASHVRQGPTQPSEGEEAAPVSAPSLRCPTDPTCGADASAPRRRGRPLKHKASGNKSLPQTSSEQSAAASPPAPNASCASQVEEMQQACAAVAQDSGHRYLTGQGTCEESSQHNEMGLRGDSMRTGQPGSISDASHAQQWLSCPAAAYDPFSCVEPGEWAHSVHVEDNMHRFAYSMAPVDSPMQTSMMGSRGNARSADYEHPKGPLVLAAAPASSTPSFQDPSAYILNAGCASYLHCNEAGDFQVFGPWNTANGMQSTAPLVAVPTTSAGLGKLAPYELQVAPHGDPHYQSYFSESDIRHAERDSHARMPWSSGSQPSAHGLLQMHVAMPSNSQQQMMYQSAPTQAPYPRNEVQGMLSSMNSNLMNDFDYPSSVSALSSHRPQSHYGQGAALQEEKAHLPHHTPGPIQTHKSTGVHDLQHSAGMQVGMHQPQHQHHGVHHIQHAQGVQQLTASGLLHVEQGVQHLQHGHGMQQLHQMQHLQHEHGLQHLHRAHERQHLQQEQQMLQEQQRLQHFHKSHRGQHVLQAQGVQHVMAPHQMEFEPESHQYVSQKSQRANSGAPSDPSPINAEPSLSGHGGAQVHGVLLPVAPAESACSHVRHVAQPFSGSSMTQCYSMPDLDAQHDKIPPSQHQAAVQRYTSMPHHPGTSQQFHLLPMPAKAHQHLFQQNSLPSGSPLWPHEQQ